MQYPPTPRSEWKMHHLCWRSQHQNVQTFGYVYQNTNGKNHGPAWKTQSFLSSEICTVILKQDYYGKGNSRKFCYNTVGKKFQIWECLFVSSEKGLFLSVHVDGTKLAGKLGEPASFIDHVYLECPQRDCETNKDILDNYRNMFESRISTGAEEKLPCSGKPDADISSWSLMIWKVMQKKCVERYCELANKTTQQLYKVATPCIDDHQFTMDESLWQTLGSFDFSSSLHEWTQAILSCG